MQKFGVFFAFHAIHTGLFRGIRSGFRGIFLSGAVAERRRRIFAFRTGFSLRGTGVIPPPELLFSAAVFCRIKSVAKPSSDCVSRFETRTLCD